MEAGKKRLAGDLVRRIRNFISKGDVNADYIDLNEAIKRGVDLALVTNELPHLKVKFALKRDILNVFADEVKIGQIFAAITVLPMLKGKKRQNYLQVFQR